MRILVPLRGLIEAQNLPDAVSLSTLSTARGLPDLPGCPVATSLDRAGASNPVRLRTLSQLIRQASPPDGRDAMRKIRPYLISFRQICPHGAKRQTRRELDVLIF